MPQAEPSTPGSGASSSPSLLLVLLDLLDLLVLEIQLLDSSVAISHRDPDTGPWSP